MRIFLIYHPSGNLSVPGSMTWFKNLYAPLVDLGHDVVQFRLDDFVKANEVVFRSIKYKELLSQTLLESFKNQHKIKPFDMVLSYLTDVDIDVGLIGQLKNTGVLTLNFSCNNTHQFHLIEKISPHFDINLYSEKDANIKFEKIGANAIWFPMAANPKYYFPQESSFKYDVTFIGAAYAKRAYYINHLVQNGINIDCFGPNWLINQPHSQLKRIKKEWERIKWLFESTLSLSSSKRLGFSSKIFDYDLLVSLRQINKGHFHYPVTDDVMMVIIHQSKINLGFLEVYANGNNHITQQHLHLREFEIPMSGGLYMTNYSDELAEFYEIDKEVIAFRNEHELTDKINYYLTHEKEALNIRKAAFERAIKSHTYQDRYKTLFKQLKLK